MTSPIDEIKDRLDIVEVISQYIKLQKAGSNYKALCPFHKEKTPSFMVSPSKQIWHCFGCGLGGDIFGFVMKIENIDFGAALRLLAQKAGVKLTPLNPQIQSEKQRLINLTEEAIQFYQKNLWQNQEVLNYLKKRGLKEETIKEFELGFAPDEWSMLVNHLNKVGYRPEDIERSGLAIRKELIQNEQFSAAHLNAKIGLADLYDRFRSRIMFPIRDINGNAIGFTGRIFSGEKKLKTIRDIEAVGKYVNTPQTLIFDKGRILYGLYKTKNYLREKGETVLTEGQMDFLSAYQNGLKNIVATSGTALTHYQLNILKRYNDRLILAYDSDEAGQMATERSISLALSYGFNIKIAIMENKDLADFLLEQPTGWQKLLENAIPIMDFYFERAKKMAEPQSIEGKKSIAAYFLPKVKKMVNALDRSYWLEKLAIYLNVPTNSLEKELNNLKLAAEFEGLREETSKEADETKADLKDSHLYQFSPSFLDRKQILAERIISLSITEPDCLKKIFSALNEFPEPYQQVLKIAKDNPDAFLKREQIQNLEIEEQLIKLIDYLYLKNGYELELLKELKIEPLSEIEKNLIELKKENIKDKLTQLNFELKQAEEENNSEKIKTLLDQINQLTQQLINYG